MLSIIRAATFTRRWVFITLLILISQLVWSGVHAVTMTTLPAGAATAISSCHDDDGNMLATAPENQDHLIGLEACCEGDCSMPGCHAASAIQDSAHNLALLPSSMLKNSLMITLPRKRSHSLYRPPIPS